MTNENVKVGTMAVAKVGCNEIEVEIIAVEDGGYTVRNKSSKVFRTRRVEPIPIPEQERKLLSLLDAAIEVLRRHPAGTALNTRELVRESIAQRLWIPTACQTPEQTLYGAIFREIKTKEQPCIVKADAKGKFRLA